MKQSLLHTPEGVKDVYGTEYAKMQKVESLLHSAIASFGYRDIRTPAFEYFDVFSSEVGTTASKELFKFFDKENDTLVLRPDFTPSIARCSAKYFLEDDSPLRFCYLGNVYSNTGSLQGKLCEETQMGAELIGDNSVEADAEIIAMVVESLKAAGLSEFQVTIGEVDYFKGLCEEAGLDGETEFQLREFISGKNIFAAQQLLEERNVAPDYREKLLKIGDSFEDHDNLKLLRENVKNARSLEAIDRLEKLYSVLRLYEIADYVSFDLGLLSKYNYYTGILFRVYTYGVGRQVVQGGRYDNLLSHFGKNAPAIGFVILVDDLLEALTRQKAAPNISDDNHTFFYDPAKNGDYEAKLQDARALRKKGQMVTLTPIPAGRKEMA
jgi:ATP phosphoribosyltransferase regulatory subunit